jgi:hypothetical protein
MAKVGGWWHGFGLSLPFFSRRVLSSKHCGPVWRQAQAQLTDAIGLSGAAVRSLLKITAYVAHLPLACACLVQLNLVLLESSSKRLHGSPVTERTNIRCERPFATSSPLHLPAWCCQMASGLFARRRHAACRQPRVSVRRGVWCAFRVFFMRGLTCV